MNTGRRQTVKELFIKREIQTCICNWCRSTWSF